MGLMHHLCDKALQFKQQQCLQISCSIDQIGTRMWEKYLSIFGDGNLIKESAWILEVVVTLFIFFSKFDFLLKYACVFVCVAV